MKRVYLWLVVGLTLTALGTAQAAPTAVLDMRFDNDAGLGESYVPGGTVHDYSGFSNHGVLLDPPGVPTWLPTGLSGGAFDFTGNGSNAGQSILVPWSPTLLPGSGDFAVALWINPRDDQDGDVLRMGSTATSSTWYKVEHSPRPGNNKISLNFNSTGNDATVNSLQAYNDAQWHFVVAQRVGNMAELWVDAVLQGTDAVTGDINPTGNLAIGSKDTQNDDFLNSALDNVAVYMGGHFTPGEIEAMSQRPTVPVPGALLLASLGAGLVSRRRRRQAV